MIQKLYFFTNQRYYVYNICTLFYFRGCINDED